MDDTTYETWLPVPGYEGLYEVSDLGRVRSLPRPWVPAARIITGRPDRAGYMTIVLQVRRTGRKNRGVHQLVADAFLGPCPPGEEVRHLDGDNRNNRLSNLAYGTKKDNAQDSVRHGTHVSIAHKAKTHCPEGHEYTPENTYINSLNPAGRMCHTCRKQKMRARYLVNREEILRAAKEARKQERKKVAASCPPSDS